MKIKYIFGLQFIVVFILFCACGKKQKPKVFDPKSYEFHDGVAWVQLYHRPFLTLYENGIVCIDENGVELFNISNVNMDDVSNFYNGIALVDHRYIIDKSGTVIHDLKKELGVEIDIFEENYFDGYIIAKKEVNEVVMTGILDSSLNWLIEPTSKLDDYEVEGNYLYYFYSLGYYDALNNQFIDEDEFKLRHIERSFPPSGIIFLKQKQDNIFTYSSEYKEGSIELSNSCKTGFYNKNFEMIINMSDYDSVKPLSDFNYNQCLIQFETKQNEHYTGIITLDGEFIFIHSGYVIEYNTEKIEFVDCYYDWDGNCYSKEKK